MTTKKRYSDTKTFSFSKENREIIDIIEQQDNQSQFIADVVRHYVNTKNMPNYKEKYLEMKVKYETTQEIMGMFLKNNDINNVCTEQDKYTDNDNTIDDTKPKETKTFLEETQENMTQINKTISNLRNQK